MMLFLLTLLAGVGAAFIVVEGSIFNGLRQTIREKCKPWVTQLTSCHQCSCFYLTALMALLLQPIYWNFSFKLLNWFFCLVVTPFVFGCAGSYLAMVAVSLFNYLEAPAMAIANKKKDDK